MADEIGPCLPPNLRKKTPQEVESPLVTDSSPEEVYGPILSGNFNTKKGTEEEKTDDYQTETEKKNEAEKAIITYGPALPPGLVRNKGPIGPALPAGWSTGKGSEDEDDGDDDVIGPSLPSDKDTVDCIYDKRLEIEQRAAAMKNKITGKEDGNRQQKDLKRETWMTELPPELAHNIGIVARTFKKKTLNSTEADRSVWTETPKDRERKRLEQMEKQRKKDTQEPIEMSKRDLEMQQRVQQHNAEHRGQSLFEMHQQEKKKKKAFEPEERRAFDRNIDLAHRSTDRKAMSSFMQKASKFSSKFENAKYGDKFL